MTPIDLRMRQWNLGLGDASDEARALAFGRALFHGLARSATSIAIAVFAAAWFVAHLISAAGQL